MRRLIIAYVALCGALFVALTAIAQVPQTGAGLAKPASGGGGTTALDPSKNNGVTLSNGNLTATETGGTAWPFVLSVGGHSTGKYYAEVTYTTLGGNALMGFASASHSTANECGNDTVPDSGSFNATHFSLFNASATNLGSTTFDISGLPNTVAVEVDFGGLTMKYNNWTRSSGWSSPISIAGLTNGPWFFCVSLNNNGTAGEDVVTVNFGGSSYVGTPDAGYGNW